MILVNGPIRNELKMNYGGNVMGPHNEVNAVIGALSVGMLFLLVLLLTGHSGAAFIAAAILALLPSHLRLSASESRFVLAALMSLWAAAMTVLYARSGRLAPGFGAAIAWAFAGQVRPEMYLLAMGIPFLALAPVNRQAHLLRTPTLLAGLLLAALVAEPVLQAFQRVTSGEGPTEAISFFKKTLDEIRGQRDILIHFESGIVMNPVIFETKMVERIGRACQRLGIRSHEMPSGAGHDASHMGELVPTGMVFIPSKDGRSHCPEEWSEFEHICLGTEVLAETVAMIDGEEHC